MLALNAASCVLVLILLGTNATSPVPTLELPKAIRASAAAAATSSGGEGGEEPLPSVPLPTPAAWTAPKVPTDKAQHVTTSSVQQLTLEGTIQLIDKLLHDMSSVTITHLILDSGDRVNLDMSRLPASESFEETVITGRRVQVSATAANPQSGAQIAASVARSSGSSSGAAAGLLANAPVAVVSSVVVLPEGSSSDGRVAASGGSTAVAAATAAAGTVVRGPRTIITVIISNCQGATASVTVDQLKAMWFTNSGSLLGWFNTCSWGGTSVNTNNSPVVRVDICVSLSPCPDADVLSNAAKVQLSTMGYRVTSYDHLVVIMPPSSCESDWGYGLGEVKGTVTWISASAIKDGLGIMVTAHEVQHNLGLYHANIPGPEETAEYKDWSCTMGNDPKLKCLNAPHNWQISWASVVPGGEFRLADLSAGRGRRFTLPAAHTNKQNMVRVQARDGNWYFASYRRSVSPYEIVPSDYADKISIHQHNGGPKQTLFLKSLSAGQSYTVAGITFFLDSRNGDTAVIRVCWLDSSNNCNAGSQTPLAPTVNPPPPPPPPSSSTRNPPSSTRKPPPATSSTRRPPPLNRRSPPPERSRRPPPATVGCEDLVNDCESWASDGYCDPKYVWGGKSVRNELCRKSCGLCLAGGCSDENSRCPTWAQQGYCSPGYLWEGQSVSSVVCRKSCGTCTDSTTCTDARSECSNWASRGYCSPSYTYDGKSVKDVLCRKSCNTCEGTGTDSDPSCTDLQTDCVDWAYDGYCDPNYFWEGQSVRDVVCRKSCRTCGGSTGDDSTAGCQDQVEDCMDWATQGYCDPKYFWQGQSVRDKVCRESCGTCSGCSDTLDVCIQWAELGYCDPQYEWEGESVSDVVCPESCGSCS